MSAQRDGVEVTIEARRRRRGVSSAKCDLGRRGWGLEFRVQVLGTRLRVGGLGCGLRVEGLRFGVWVF